MTAKKCTDQQICDLADRGVSISEMRRILHADTPRIKQVAPDAGRHPVPAETIEPYIREGYAHTQIAKILHVAPTSIKKLFPGTQWTKADAGKLGLMSRKLEEI